MFKTKITAIALSTVLVLSAVSLAACTKNGEENGTNATSGTSSGLGEAVSEIVSDITDGIMGTEEVSKENAENGHVTDTADREDTTVENESGMRKHTLAGK